MAIAGSQITGYGHFGMGNGKTLIWGYITGPTSYTSAGEDITRAVASSIWGVKDILGLACSPAGDTTFAAGAICNFERTASDATNVGTFHFYNSGSDGHTHDLLIIGGQAAQTHTHDIRIIGGQAAAGTDTVQGAAGDLILGKEEAANALIAGADEATKGGVVAGSISTAISMISTDTLGKEQATNRTIVGTASATKGGVVASAADVATTEAASTTNFSTYTFFVWGIGGS
jgi:hypothetical protein